MSDHCPPRGKSKSSKPPRLAPSDPARDKAELLSKRQKIVDLIQKRPEKAALILSSWLNQAGATQKPPAKKKAG